MFQLVILMYFTILRLAYTMYVRVSTIKSYVTLCNDLLTPDLPLGHSLVDTELTVD